jgi:epoxyqueuosine reductase
MHQALPENPRLMARAPDFEPITILTMDEAHYTEKVWPLAFYISRKMMSKWQMNAARALGNLGDRDHIPALIQAFSENPDESVRGMSAWAMGRLGCERAKRVLESRRSVESEQVREEIDLALGAI